MEIGVLELLNVGAISILDYHLNDARFCEYLQGAIQDGCEVYCRYMPPEGQRLQLTAETMVALANTYPWVKGWLPFNEPNLEYPHLTPMDLNVRLGLFLAIYGQALGDPRLLYYPPMAQDMGGDRDHRVLYDTLRPSVETWLEAGAGFALHSYWDRGDFIRLVEKELPTWLRVNMPWDRTLIHEAGRKPDAVPPGTDGLVSEIGQRFSGPARLSKAHAATYWILSSEDPAFADQAWMDTQGNRRQVLYDMVAFGP